MYSWQISETIKNNNYNIDSDTYMRIIKESPQVNHVIYHPFSDSFEMWDAFGEHWNFRVYLRKEE